MSVHEVEPAAAAINDLMGLAAAGQWLELERSAQQLLQGHPGTGFLWKALGLARWNQGKSALEALQRAAALAPEDAEIHSNLALAWLEAGKHELAEQRCRAAIAMKPEFAEAHANLGNVLRAMGRLPEAEVSYSEACRLRPRFAEVHSNWASVLRSQGRAAEAVNHCQRALQLNPTLVAAHCNLGNALRDLGQTDDAIAAYRRALELNPALTEAHNDLGNAQLDLGQVPDALQSYHRAIALQPHDADAHSNAGNALRLLGRLPEAIESCRRALDLDPNLADAHTNLGNALRQSGQLDQALESYRHAVSLQPDHAAAHGNLGNVLLDLERLEEAVASYERALELKPDAEEIHTHLGHVQWRLWRTDQAAASYLRALELKSDQPAALSGLATTLLERGGYARAEEYYRQALRLDPASIDSYHGLGVALRQQNRASEAEASCRQILTLDPAAAPVRVLLSELTADRGDFKQAEEYLRSAIAIQPGFAPAWAGLAHIRRMGSADAEWLDRTQSLAHKSAPRDEVLLRFALGKYFDDVGDYDQAFANFLRANDLARRHRGEYDAAVEERMVDALIRHYDAAWFGRPHPQAELSHRPIFVVGMQRSGTTLTEQTIAAHSDVFGVGELRYWPATVHDDTVVEAAAEENELGNKARGFLNLLATFNADAPRVVEKTCINYFNLGAIHAALPNARIICVTRHPIDNLLSVFSNNYSSGHNWSNSLEGLSRRYRGFRRIMRHWRAHLPAGVMLEVPYEQLVQDHEGWARRMLEFLDLPWDPRCLQFHENEGTVRSFSRWQVRQKVSKTSVERWRRYEKHLGPLMSLLDERD
jgi:tetratricopeptide (TPR) repeat protein